MSPGTEPEQKKARGSLELRAERESLRNRATTASAVTQIQMEFYMDSSIFVLSICLETKKLVNSPPQRAHRGAPERDAAAPCEGKEELRALCKSNELSLLGFQKHIKLVRELTQTE